MVIFNNLYIVLSLVAIALLTRIIKMPDRVKLTLITIYSFVVIVSLRPVFAAILFLILIITYGLVQLQQKEKMSPLWFFATGLALFLIILIVGKYGLNTLYDLWYRVIWGADDSVVYQVLAPLGISYIAVRGIQLVLDCRRGLIEKVDFLDMMAFMVFLPTFAAGPIESYNSFKQAEIQDYTQDDFFYGIKRIIIGYFQKKVIVDAFINYYLDRLIDIQLNKYSIGVPALISVIIIFVKAYFDLAAYSHIAIGFARLLGYKVRENFNRPFWKRNISEFWRSWHMSLSQWCVTNVYFPVYGATRKVWLALYASMIVMGMWHFVNLNWLAWAVHHATGLVFFWLFGKYTKKHKKVARFFNYKIVRFFSHILTFIYVSIGYAFVGSESFIEGVHLYIDAILTIPEIIVKVIGFLL